jgi:tetratricopeptide (TPR) repeat protein
VIASPRLLLTVNFEREASGLLPSPDGPPAPGGTRRATCRIDRPRVASRRPVRRLVPLLAALCALVALAPRAEARRIGFANLARDGQAGKAAIDADRARMVKQSSGEEITTPGARAALEDPVGPTSADDAATIDRARTLVAAARTALKAFDYDEALDDLRQADATQRALAPGAGTTPELYEVVLLAGQVYAAKGDEQLALGAFQLARRLAPDKPALDPARYRPQVVALYDRAGDADAGTGSFHVVSEPPGASVFVDGKPAGVSPLELTGLGAGEHYLGLALDGHASRHERIVVGKGARSEQSYLLARLPAEQRARSLRAGLSRPGLSYTDYRRGAALLADVASVDVLVLVRDREGGGVEAATFDAHTSKLSTWVDLNDGGKALAATLPAADAGAIALPTTREVAGPLAGAGDLGKDRKEQNRQPRWYRTWWGVSLLIGGGVLVTGAILIATSPGAKANPDSLVVNNPHWNEGVFPAPLVGAHF